MQTLLRFKGYIVLSCVWATLFGAYMLYDRRPQPEPIVITTPTATLSPTPGPLTVHVVGAVACPGVYTLPAGSRLAQAVEAAGGFASAADTAAVNLADYARDGQQVFIPTLGATPPPSPTPADLTTDANSRATSLSVLVNINTATLAELDALPGIGPVYAQRIIEYREAHGPFTDPAQIMEIKGIGPATYERIKALITLR